MYAIRVCLVYGKLGKTESCASRQKRGRLEWHKLTYSGQTTASIAFNASAAQVQAALEALSNIAPGDVVVTKLQDTSSAQEWRLSFQGALGGANLAEKADTLISEGRGRTRAGPGDRKRCDITPFSRERKQTVWFPHK